MYIHVCQMWYSIVIALVSFRCMELHIKWYILQCIAIVLCDASLEHLRLKDCLPYCDSNVQELDGEWVDLPDEILVEHAVHVWHIAVHHQAKLLQEGRD